MTKISDPWTSGVLSPDHHDRLVAGIDQIAMRAGLGVAYKHLIWTKAELAKGEMQWCQYAVEMVRADASWMQPLLGICYRINQKSAEETMLAMTGLLVRNFVDARCLSRMDVLAERKSERGSVDATALMVPDFVTPESLESLPAWERNALSDFVHERVRENLPTCLYVGATMDKVKEKLPSVWEDLHGSFKIEVQ